MEAAISHKTKWHFFLCVQMQWIAIVFEVFDCVTQTKCKIDEATVEGYANN